MPAGRQTQIKIFSRVVECTNECMCMVDLEDEINQWLIENDGKLQIEHYQFDTHCNVPTLGHGEMIHITVSIFYYLQ